ncbi:hypothetical protein ABE42_00010, partial [Bacillus thuringiensis]|nr:hypothetical protein [Bacillus thuringiensis]
RYPNVRAVNNLRFKNVQHFLHNLQNQIRNVLPWKSTCKSKQKVIHQLQALATLLEEESHEQYQFSIQIETTCLK